MKSFQLCPALCNPTDYNLPGSSIHGIFQERTLEWVAISFSRRSSQLRDWTQVSCTVGRYFTIWATREVWGKTYHDTSLRMWKYETNTKRWWGCGPIGTLIHCCWECKMVQPLWKTVWQFLTKLNLLSLCDPAIMLLSIYSKEAKVSVNTKTFIRIFITALFIIAQTWKQLRCPLVGKWICKQQDIQTMEYYSVLTRNELSSHEKTWGIFKCILLSGRRQFEKATVWFKLYDILEKAKYGDNRKISGCHGWGGGKDD